jgi:hypothetical protein
VDQVKQDPGKEFTNFCTGLNSNLERELKCGGCGRITIDPRVELQKSDSLITPYLGKFHFGVSYLDSSRVLDLIIVWQSDKWTLTRIRYASGYEDSSLESLIRRAFNDVPNP